MSPREPGIPYTPETLNSEIMRRRSRLVDIAVVYINGKLVETLDPINLERLINLDEMYETVAKSAGFYYTVGWQSLSAMIADAFKDDWNIEYVDKRTGVYSYSGHWKFTPKADTASVSG